MKAEVILRLKKICCDIDYGDMALWLLQKEAKGGSHEEEWFHAN